MKKSIPFLALILFFSSACNKGTEVQTTEDINKLDDAQANERGICCCKLTVITTAFGGLVICGVAPSPMGIPCNVATSCGVNTCGDRVNFPGPGKNITFCYEDDCAICFTNPAGFQIQFTLDCWGLSGPITLNAGETKCFVADCNTGFHQCP